MTGNPPPWSPEELAYLATHDASMPLPLVADSVHRQSQEQGWPVRSKKAIRMKRQQLGLANPNKTSMRTGEFTTTGGVARILGTYHKRIYDIVADPANQIYLKPVRLRYNYCISRDGWRRLASERPEALAHFDPDRLSQLLGDRDLTEQVDQVKPPRHSIRCIETGQEWANAAAAGAELFVSASGLNKAVRQRRPVAVLGLSFERVRGGSIMEPSPPDRPMAHHRRPYQQRVVEEKALNDARLERLTAFIGSDAFDSVLPGEQARLERQRGIMLELSQVLGERISAFEA